MRKVYCKNCKWYNWQMYLCFHPDNTYYEDHFSGRNKRYEESPISKNAKNNCSNYQRKWWKFWINEEREDD